MQRAYCCMREHFGFDIIDGEMFEMIERRLDTRRYKTA